MQNAFGTQEEESILVEDSDSETGDSGDSCQAVDDSEVVEVIPAACQIYFELDDGVAENVVINNQQPIAANNNNLPYLSEDVDADAAFLSLVAGELHKMPPSRRQQFKRNVTRLLYS